MKPQFTDDQFYKAKGNDLLPCKCYFCDSIFMKSKSNIQLALSPNHTDAGKFCSIQCAGNSRKKRTIVTCLHCNTNFEKLNSKIKKTPNHFCSRTCTNLYYTFTKKRKSNGSQRSKLELWLEVKLKTLYPSLHFSFNDREAIGSELDIYIPKLKLAFELNGIYHYEPIFGHDKLSAVQQRDVSKTKACFDNEIDLCVIDTTSLTYFKEIKAQVFLNIITSIINSKN